MKIFVTMLIPFLFVSNNATSSELPVEALSDSFVIEKTLNLPISEVWQLWVNPQKLSNWLAASAIVEEKAGGKYELFWDLAHSDQNSTIGCHIIEIESEMYLAFEWKGPAQFSDLMNTQPLPTWVKITFSKESDNRTHIKLEHFGWKTSFRWKEAEKWQKISWERALNNL